MASVRSLLLALMLIFAAAPAAGWAQALIVRADVDYREIKPQPADAGGRIEVIEFFWYGCPYCHRLQPALDQWLRNKPDDVVFRRIPAILRESWAPHARLFYTLEALGESRRLHAAVYQAQHGEGLSMGQPEVIADWAQRQGIARERWTAAYNAATVLEQVQVAARLTREYGVTGTPSLVVDGRYLSSGSMVETLDGLIPVVDGLVARVRATR